MTERLLDTHEALTRSNSLQSQLLDFIDGFLTARMEQCKNAPRSSDGTKDIRLINVAGFCAELKSEINKKRQELEGI